MSRAARTCATCSLSARFADLMNLIVYVSPPQNQVHAPLHLSYFFTLTRSWCIFMYPILQEFNSNISQWATSNVENMAGMLQNLANFNVKIGVWEVSEVTSMESMFEMATNFNQGLSKWNVFKVTNMKSMFKHASSFNQDIKSWMTSQVTTMGQMFSWGAFNQNILSWEVSLVTDVNETFYTHLHSDWAGAEGTRTKSNQQASRTQKYPIQNGSTVDIQVYHLRTASTPGMHILAPFPDTHRPFYYPGVARIQNSILVWVLWKPMKLLQTVGFSNATLTDNTI